MAASTIEQPASAERGSGARKRTVVTLVDQAAYSASNFALAVVVAHFASRHDYGVFAVALAAFLIGGGANRGMTGEMLVLKLGATEPEHWRRLIVRFVSRAAAIGLMFGVVLAAIVTLALPVGFTGTFLALAVSAPFLFAQDTIRYASFACGRPHAALVSDVTFGAVQVLATIALIVAGSTSVPALTVGWAAGAVVGLVAGFLALRLPRSAAVDGPSFAWNDGLSVRLGIDNILNQLTQQGTTFLIAGLGAVAAAANLRVVQTLFGPAIVLVLGFQAAYTRELVRRRQISFVLLRSSVRRAGVGLGLFILVTALVAVAVPDSVGLAVFGPSWHGTRILLLIFAVGAIGGGISSAAVAGLRALEDARSTLRVRISSVVVVLGLVALGGAFYSVRGAVAGLSVGSAVMAVYWWLQFERSWGARRRPLPGTGPHVTGGQRAASRVAFE